ncbi:MAG: rRNA maturation RNase YbeY [bacterium]|nr:rRNA maturation RNase YbeY [bacterium]
MQNPCRYPEAGARHHRRWLAAVVADAAPWADSLVVRFVSDRAMRRLNSTYRRQDRSTDVLSFPGYGQPGYGQPGDGQPGDGLPESHLGDVVVSVPTARRQAAELGHGVERELRILMLHGILHCLGHDHTTDDGTMERLEQRLQCRWITDE